MSRKAALILFAILSLAISHAGSTQSNAFASVLSSVDRARFESEIQKVEQILPSIPDRGAALYFLARRYAQVGNLQKALALLTQCVSLDEGFDPTGVSAFKALQDSSEFRHLAKHAHALNPPVHRARIAFEFNEQDLFPEGLAADQEKGLFYMSSALKRKIISFDANGQVADFVPSNANQLLGVNGVRVDPADHSVWAATAADDVSEAAVVHFDSHGRLLGRFAALGPPPHDFNDLVICDSGYVFVTDTSAHQVYRLDVRAAIFQPVLLSRPLLYPNGITLSADGKLLYVADYLGLIRMEVRSNKAEEVKPGPGNTLAGIDGLYSYKDGLVGVQYGTSSYRVMRWQLSADGRQITSARVLESQSSFTKFPTTGAIVGQKFYFIANADFDNLVNGKILDPQKLEHVQIAMVALN